jgi:uncharacterized membrane protein
MGDEARTPHLLAGLVLGIGLGGFVDGILLHQVLQWHHMLTSEGCCSSSTVAGLEDNTLADGLFHVAAWLAVVAGTAAYIREWQRGRVAPPWRAHAGAVLFGWGAFNLVEGLIDHELLGIHHVRDDLGGPLGWDIGFLALAVVQMAAGWKLFASARRVGTRLGCER